MNRDCMANDCGYKRIRFFHSNILCPLSRSRFRRKPNWLLPITISNYSPSGISFLYLEFLLFLCYGMNIPYQFIILTHSDHFYLPYQELDNPIWPYPLTHAMIFKSFLLKWKIHLIWWNSDFRTISHKRMKKILLIFFFYESLLTFHLFLILYLYPIEEIKEVEKFVDLWLKKKNKKTGVLLNFKYSTFGKRQRLLAYLAKKNRVRYKKLISQPKIAKLREEIALNFPGTSLLKELATLIICSNIRRGNSIKDFLIIIHFIYRTSYYIHFIATDSADQKSIFKAGQQ
ncbi:hypothetical protein ACJX0J_012562 [Zea mays]